jgi:hypothetical protein
MASATFIPDLAAGLAETLSDNVEKVEELSTKDVQAALLVCTFMQTLLKMARGSIESSLRQGVDARAFASTYERSIAGLDSASKAVGRLLQRGHPRHWPILGEELLSGYEDLAADLAKLRQFLVEAVAKAKAPPRPLDWERVRQAEAAYGRGETKPFDKGSTIHGDA